MSIKQSQRSERAKESHIIVFSSRRGGKKGVEKKKIFSLLSLFFKKLQEKKKSPIVFFTQKERANLGGELAGRREAVVDRGVGEVLVEVLDGALAGDDGLDEESEHREHGEAGGDFEFSESKKVENRERNE